jgi:hypothetical protein
MFCIPSPYSLAYLETMEGVEDSLNSIHGPDFCWSLFVQHYRDWPSYFAALETLYTPPLF